MYVMLNQERLPVLMGAGVGVVMRRCQINFRHDANGQLIPGSATARVVLDVRGHRRHYTLPVR